MNINLLPKKFIKNQATAYIIVVSSAMFIFLTISFLFVFLFYQTQVGKYTNEVQQKQIEKVQLEKQIKELEQTQSKDLQDFLLTFKEEQKTMEPIMTAFSEAADKVDLLLLDYSVSFAAPENDLMLTGADGSELLSSITIRVRGDLYDGLPKLKKQLEAIEWVYDCHPVSISPDTEYTDGEFVIRIKAAEAPKILRNGAAENE